MFLFLPFTIHCSLFTVSYAAVVDRVVAFVDDRAVTSVELEETYEKAGQKTPDISREEVLNTIINRILLLKEAKKLKIEAKTEDEFINEYIDLKVRAFIRLKEEDLREFYNADIAEFKGADYDTVRDKIEEYLTEKEVNNLLKRHIAELKSKAYVKVLSPELQK